MDNFQAYATKINTRQLCWFGPNLNWIITNMTEFGSPVQCEILTLNKITSFVERIPRATKKKNNTGWRITFESFGMWLSESLFFNFEAFSGFY